ncbi:hypothetical protein AAFF_G00310590 [Aldrovandia affinis]|uniref:Uncharacterized protein n=1 Tax=Aldrovandia affinis TaxID=143900 RepID=A0AAD7RA86_9TELE|nr:hypothetical protein AAFF_G00310590 [Aldrovandia affinis]
MPNVALASGVTVALRPPRPLTADPTNPHNSLCLQLPLHEHCTPRWANRCPKPVPPTLGPPEGPLSVPGAARPGCALEVCGLFSSCDRERSLMMTIRSC